MNLDMWINPNQTHLNKLGRLTPVQPVLMQVGFSLPKTDSYRTFLHMRRGRLQRKSEKVRD